MRRNVSFWRVVSDCAAQRSGRFRGRSGHAQRMLKMAFMTHNVISPPSIDALRKLHSITALL